jgi:preprotein translocase subunit SecD
MSKKVILIVAAVLLVSAGSLGGLAYVVFQDTGRAAFWVYRYAVLLSARGGPEIVLEVDADAVRRRSYELLRRSAVLHLRDAKLSFNTRQTDAGVEVLAKEADRENALSVLRSKLASTVDIRLADDGVIHIGLSDEVLASRTVEIAEQSQLQLSGRMLDLEMKVAVTVQQQPAGHPRLLVRMARSEDPQRVLTLVSKPGVVAFRMIDVSTTPEKALKSAPPANAEILYGREEEGKLPYLVEKRALLKGSDLAGAQPSNDERTNEPVVTFQFSPAGARKFAQATGENVGRPFAIVVDGEVVSAPIIREPITGGSGQISGNFTARSASELAAVLRYGELPARLKVVEEHAAKAR